MEIRCEIEIECRDEREAKIVERALRIDNEGYMESFVKGKRVVAKIFGENALSILHTINDFMACLQLAVESVKIIEEDE